jgi:hypothetical protein
MEKQPRQPRRCEACRLSGGRLYFAPGNKRVCKGCLERCSLTKADIAEEKRAEKREAAREEASRLADYAAAGGFKNPVCGHVRPTQLPEGELLVNVSVYRFSCGCIHLVGDGEECVTSDGWWGPARARAKKRQKKD